MQGEALSRADTLRAALDSVFASPAYRWETREDPLGALRRLWAALDDYLTRLHQSNPAAFRLLAWVLVAILIAIVAHALWVALRTVGTGSRSTSDVTALPTLEARDARWFAREAARLAQAGEFVAAMQADFLRLVLELDGKRVVAFHPSKTPSEYVRDAALDETGRRALRALVREMYSYAFAREPLDRAQYERWHGAAAVERYAPAH
jgi:hypothetical protein